MVLRCARVRAPLRARESSAIMIEVHKKHIRNNKKVNVTIMTNVKFKILFVYIILEFSGI